MSRCVASVSFGKDSLAIERPMKKWSNQKYGEYGNVRRMAEVFKEESRRTGA